MIPGFPVTAPAAVTTAPVAPQGYPGPTVVGAPVGAPAPVMHARAPMAGAYDTGLGAAMASAQQEERTPQPLEGAYELQITAIAITTKPQGAPGAGRKTLIATFCVLASSNPACPVGSYVSYVEGLEYGMGRAQTFVLVATGWINRAQFDQAHAAQGQDPIAALTAVCNAGTIAGEANPLISRKVSASVQVVSKVNKAGQPVTFREWRFAPA